MWTTDDPGVSDDGAEREERDLAPHCTICDGACEYLAIGKRAPRDNHELHVILAHTTRPNADLRCEASA